jgi:nitric oxide reductase large subunit
MRAVLTAATALVLSSCVVVPQTREVYDSDCQVTHKQIVLEAGVIGGFHHCGGDGCAVMLAAYGAVAVASAVVSGSIAVVGNVIYWAEKQGRCLPRSLAASAPKS